MEESLDRAQLLALITHALSQGNVTAPINTPAAPALPYPPPSRFKKFGGYYVCERCQLVQEFCGCAKAPPPPSPPTQDGAESGLSKLIKDCQAR